MHGFLLEMATFVYICPNIHGKIVIESPCPVGKCDDKIRVIVKDTFGRRGEPCRADQYCVATIEMRHSVWE